MRAYRQDALRALGFELERYFVSGWPPVWGLALKRDGEDVVVIESHGDHVEEETEHLRNKYVVRDVRTVEGKVADSPDDDVPNPLGRELAVFKTQREAAAWAARRF